MASSSNGSIRMNILSGSAARRQRAGDENSTETANESEQIIEFPSALAYFLKVFIGCGIYAIPAAALIGGSYIGSSLIFSNYIMVTLCLYILIKNADGSKNYPEFIKKRFDRNDRFSQKASKILRIFVILFGFAFSFCICSVYLIFIVTHICKIMYVWRYYNPFEEDEIQVTKFEFELDELECRWWTPLMAIILLIFCFLPIWNKIALYTVALVGMICQVAVLILGLISFIDYDDNAENINIHQSFDPSNVFLVQSIAIYAGEGINMIFPLMAVMKEPAKFLGFPSLLACGMMTATIFAIIIIIIEIVDARKLHILLNVYFCYIKRPFSVSSTVLKFMASISLICTYPIQLDAAYHYIVDEFNINQKKLAQYGVRFVLVLFTIFPALIHCVYLIFFMGMIGSLYLSVLVLIVPGLVPFWTKSYGKMYWMAVVGTLALIIGILLFFGGTIKNAISWSDFANLKVIETQF